MCRRLGRLCLLTQVVVSHGQTGLPCLLDLAKVGHGSEEDLEQLKTIIPSWLHHTIKSIIEYLLLPLLSSAGKTVLQHLPGWALTGQKRAPDLITGGCEPPSGCWELNSGPLEEQSVLLPTEPSLQP
ncbi:uncharacterized protein LOC119805911 isoform X3 [Arvicola amphibius]|uniref:uncharacterized protein LOC119805911 isoform X3 n=1 Tax=Arvicola amphibius TaxID=1047088 RepID=UPI0018E3B3FF|nr:uncharacterized protein LOC119805911 isoform X3 [Arvicola amphibius]